MLRLSTSFAVSWKTSNFAICQGITWSSVNRRSNQKPFLIYRGWGQARIDDGLMSRREEPALHPAILWPLPEDSIEDRFKLTSNS